MAWALASHANTQTGQCNPKRETLAADIGTKRLPTISTAITLLRDAGLLEVEYGRGKQASYCAKFQTYAQTDVREPSDQIPEVREGVRQKYAQANVQKYAQANVSKENYEVEQRKELKEEEEEVSAREILSIWNRVTEQRLSTAHWLDMISDRLGDGLMTGWSLANHEAFIRNGLTVPYWEGTPTPAVFYKDAAQVERTLSKALAAGKRVWGEWDEEWSAEQCRWVPAAKAKCPKCGEPGLVRDMDTDHHWSGHRGEGVCLSCIAAEREEAEKYEERQRALRERDQPQGSAADFAIQSVAEALGDDDQPF